MIRKIVNLGDICVMGSGGTPDRSRADYYGGSIPWIKSGELNGRVVFSSEETLTERGIRESSAKVVPPGAILIAMYGATAGRTAVLGVPAATNQAVCHLLPNPAIVCPRYLLHAIDRLLPDFLRKRVGGAQPNISQGIIRGTRIPLPPLSEQERIAAVLDKANRIQENCAGFGCHIGDLVNHRFRALASGSHRVCKVGEIGQVQGGVQVTPRRAAYPIEVPYLRVANVFRDRLDLREVKSIRVASQEFSRVTLKLGDILIVEGHGNQGEIGRAAVWNGEISNCVHQNHLIRVRIDSNAAVPEYVNHALNSPDVRSQLARLSGTISGLNTISTADVKDLTINLPPVAEQVEFRRLVRKARQMSERFLQRACTAKQMYKALEAKSFDGI